MSERERVVCVWRNRSRSSWGLSLSACVWRGSRVTVGYGFPTLPGNQDPRDIKGDSRVVARDKRDPASKFLHLGGRRTDTRPRAQSRPEYNTKHRL